MRQWRQCLTWSFCVMATSGCLLLTLWIRRESIDDPDALPDMTRCHDYCENSHLCYPNDDDLSSTEGHHIRVFQPVNTWTNLAYVMAGFWPLTRRVDLSTIMFASANLYLGIGSVMFHATLDETWAAYDVSGMYAVLMVLVGHGFCAVVPHMVWRWWSALIVFAVAGVFPQAKDELDDVHIGSSRIVAVCFFLMVLLKLSLIWKNRDGTLSRWLRLITRATLPGLLLGLGVLSRSFDANKKWCNPTSILQGHGMWHCLTAVSVLLSWIFFDGCQDYAIKNLESSGPLVHGSSEEDEEKLKEGEDGIIVSQTISDPETSDESEDVLPDVEKNASASSFVNENRTIEESA